MAYLEMQTGREAGKKIQLDDVMSLGRNADNKLVLSDSRVSRYHAHIIRRGDDFFLEDLAAANGTFLKDQPLPPHDPRKLMEGDEIRIGGIRMIFHLYRFLSSSSEIPRPTGWVSNPPNKGR